MDIHPLDLPLLPLKPTSEQIWAILNKLKVETRNFESPPPLQPQILNWLSKLVSTDLDWLEQDDAANILDFASERIAQSCGIAARSNMLRPFDVGNLEFQLHEPGLSNDNIGHKTWGSCLVLANRLVSSPELLVGRVIELGSGTGLCGMICAHLGHDSLLTDLPQIVENIERNIEHNTHLLNASCAATVLDWSNPVSPSGEFDTIVISDPVYSDKAPKQISTTLKLLKVPRLLLQLPLRAKFEDLRQELYEGIESAGYERTHYIQEDGDDDFGRTSYVFSMWVLNSGVN